MRLLRNKFPPSLVAPLIESSPDVEIAPHIKRRNFQQDKYVEFLKRFVEERCTYDYQRLTSIANIKKAYSLFVIDNEAEVKKYDVNYTLTPSDICKIDPRYVYKSVTVCKFCKKKQFANCCPDYVDRSHRTKNCYLLNLAC